MDTRQIACQRSLSLVKVLGADNIADVLTKHVDRATLCKHMKGMGLRQGEGRPELAPRIDG